MPKVELKLDWCSHEAAKYAVEKWHYSHVVPAGKLVKIGVWENKIFIGCVIFSRGANNNIGKPYKLKQTEICELTRVALHKHETPVSRIVAIAIKMLCKQSPEIRLMVSYADQIQQGHMGGIYQAMNWVYSGSSQAQREVIVNGQLMHKRTANSLFGTIKGLEKSQILWKHTYLYPLDDAMRKQIAPLAKPYPKRQHADEATKSAAGVQPDNGGATPTRSLHQPKLSE